MDDERDTGEVALRDGTSIFLREVRPDDKAALAAGFERLSPESRYRRFFTAMNRLSESDLRYLTEVDHHDHEAVIGFDGAAEPVGVARYVRGEVSGEAEVAVVVVDDWQGRGVGTALLERLVKRARENGIERFVATVLTENAEAIELFRSLAPGDTEPRRRTEPGQVTLIVDVPQDGVRGTVLGRALRTAAAGALEMQPWRLIRDQLQALGEARVNDPPEGENRPDR